MEATGRLENSFILFSSDHGDYLGDHGLIGKGSFYEASTRIPLPVQMPERVGTVYPQGTTCTDPGR